MNRRIAAMLICLAFLLVLPGCSAILDGDTGLMITAHKQPATASAEGVKEVNTYDELKEYALGLIMAHEELGLIHVALSYNGDVQGDANRICTELKNDDPFGAFAVSSMNATSNQIVSYYEVEIHINYNDVTKEELAGIDTVWTLRSLRSDLQGNLEKYAPSLTVLAKGITLTEDDALDMIRQIYYENPMDIVMLPVMTPPTFYPDQGQSQDRIIQFTFSYRFDDTNTLRAMGEALADTVRTVAESATGGNDDAAILLSLAKQLIAITEYDAAKAVSGDYSNQTPSATAYGALVNGSAVDEGYAMAYKALCDDLGITCDVVLGMLDGKHHAWNIVGIDGYYYHVDVSMCDVNGLDTAFLKNDTEMNKQQYSWDTVKYKICNGTLTYGDLTSGTSGSPTGSPSPSAHAD